MVRLSWSSRVEPQRWGAKTRHPPALPGIRWVLWGSLDGPRDWLGDMGPPASASPTFKPQQALTSVGTYLEAKQPDLLARHFPSARDQWLWSFTVP